jgi:crotonobetainyl-CoA:carnitine CoA-transferase CaiB-like acyl-CoA transferase
MPPLEGILVADFSRVLAGPLCTQMLADAGARVIKVEEPERGDETRRWGPPFAGGESAYFLSVNRNKESVCLDLKGERGREIAARLITRADVVVENFRRDQRARLGVAASQVHALNPRAVLCSISGFEADGPDAEVPGYDLLAQAAGGLMSITGEPEGDPMKVGVALSDVLTAHYAYGAIVASLYARERTGRGDAIEVSLFGATVASLVNVAQSHLLTRDEPKRWGNAHPSIVPYQAFRAADGMFVLGVGTDRQFDLLCRQVLAKPELAEDVRYASNDARVRNRVELVALLETIFGGSPAAEWVSRCRAHSIPAARVETLSGVFARAGSLMSAIEHPSVGSYTAVGSPVRRLSGNAAPLPPPRLGEHTEAVLRELGFESNRR